MTRRDYYEILEISRNASPEDIKRAYRRLALLFHPDRNPGNKEAEEKFKEASEAYSALADPEKRATYDRFGHEGLRGEGFQGFSGFDSSVFEGFEDILGNLFGFGDIFGGSSRRRRQSAQRGQDLVLEIELTLEEAATGAEKEIKLNRAGVCFSCRGSRLKPGTSKSVCPACQGRGQVMTQHGFFTLARTCSRCEGAGEIISHPCPDCRGTGRTREKRTLTVRIPEGVDDGSRLRLEHEGEPGDREGQRGDLYVVLKVAQHPFFQREENNLRCDVPVSFTQASLGATLEIPLLGGETELLKITPGAQTGDVIRVKGKGMPDLRSRRKGDLFVRVSVRTPDNLTHEEKSLLRQLAELRGEKPDQVDRSLPGRVKSRFHEGPH